MGGGGSQNQTTRTEPWSGQQPYLTDVFGQAQNIYYGGGPQYFPGQTVAPFSPQQQLAMDLTTQRALGGDPSQQAFGNWMTGALQQPNIDPSQIAAGGFGAMGALGPGQQFMQQAGQAGPSFGQAAGMTGFGTDIGLPGAAQFAGGVTGPYTQQLQGMTGYGGLGEASQFFGQAAPGALPAAQQYAQQALGGGPTSLGAAMGAAGGAIDPRAAAQLGATAGGAYMPGQNPYLDQLFETGAGRIQEQFAENVLPQLQGQFGAAGRTGSGAAALMQGRAAGDVAQEMAGLYGDIYAPAYEAERGRQLQAAGQLGQLGVAGGQLGADIYGTAGQLGLGAGGLAGDLFGQQAQAELARRTGAADLYGTERGLAQQAAQAAGQLGLGGGQLASQLYGTGLQGELGRLGYTSDLYGGGLDRMLQAGQGLGQLGLGGMEGLAGLYGDIGQQQFRAGTLAPTLQQMQYGDIGQLMQTGNLTQDQAQRLIQADMDRWNFQQQAPWANLGQYANLIQGVPSGLGTTTQSGPDRGGLRGAAGGALTGASLGSVVPGIGTGIGAGIGALGGLLGWI